MNIRFWMMNLLGGREERDGLVRETEDLMWPVYN